MLPVLGAFGGITVRWGIVGMSCKDTIHLICWYLEGKLSSSVSTEIDKHLATCSNCQLVLDAAKGTLEQYFSPDRSGEAPQAA